MGSELDRLARMMKMRTDDEIESRRQTDFYGRKEAVERLKREKRKQKQERRRAG